MISMSCFAESRCITGTVKTSCHTGIPGVLVKFKNNESISTTTGHLGTFKICNVPEKDVLMFVKTGYMLPITSPTSHEGITDYETYVDADEEIEVKLDQWFLERDVTISAFFEDIPDCKVSNAEIWIMPKPNKSHIHLMEGCANSEFGLEIGADGNWHLDCFYPGITTTYERLHPIKPSESNSGNVYLQHPALRIELDGVPMENAIKVKRGKYGTDYTIGALPADKDYYPDYVLNLGGTFNSEYLEQVLDKRVQNNELTQGQASWYWHQALKNCSNTRPKRKYDNIQAVEPGCRYNYGDWHKFSERDLDVLEQKLDKHVEMGHITQSAAAWYWKDQTRNCPRLSKKRKYADIIPVEPNMKYDYDLLQIPSIITHEQAKFCNECIKENTDVDCQNNTKSRVPKTDLTSAENMINESKEKSDAEQNYEDAKSRETSTANRMLGGATMAVTGIGGMQLAQGLAEQSADKAAEADMQAYLATFTCKVGDKGGKSYKGGETGMEVAGGNQLTSLYQQYVDLAADLKERKTALGMAPGIESTVIMDKANVGLYDATSDSGIKNGTYASLYRASQGNNTDKQKLADQKDTSDKQIKSGAVATGVGAVGGVVGNVLIDRDTDKQ